MSDKINNGGRAFPYFAPAVPIGSPARLNEGMSYRAWLIGQALCGAAVRYKPDTETAEQIASNAVEIADAVIAKLWK